MIAVYVSAFLAFFFREKGHERVPSILYEACLSAVTLAEVVGRFVMDGHDAFSVLQRLTASPVKIVPFGPPDAALSTSLSTQNSKTEILPGRSGLPRFGHDPAHPRPDVGSHLVEAGF
jgi:PIN domain nuclease of toxin-antitoxin system